MRRAGQGKREGAEAEVKLGIGEGVRATGEHAVAQATQYPLAIIIRAEIVSSAGSSSDSLPC